MNTEPKFYVYEHIRPDTGAVFYVGKGSGTRAINFNARGTWWKNIYKKVGSVEVRYPVKNVDEELSFLSEIEYIDVLRRRGVSLINHCIGGEGRTGWVPSEETRKKIGLANKYTPKARGENHGMYGKKHSPESLEKMSVAQKGRQSGEKHPFYGKSHTAETKIKISKSRKGKNVGKDNPFYGKRHPEELMLKIANSLCGRKDTPEQRAKKKSLALILAPKQPSVKPVFCVTNGVRYYGINDAAKKLNLHRQTIRMVCNGTLKQTGGYKFIWSDK
jgi:hypothetical protein